MPTRDGDASSQRSGNSGASGLSETSSQRSDSKFLKRRAPRLHTRNEEEADVLEQKRNFQDGVFACMFTLVRQSAMSHWKYALLKIVLEFLMNFVVAFNPSFKVWHIDRNNPVWLIIRWTVWRSPIMRIYGYKTYIVIMYVMAAAVLISVVGLGWLTLAMRRQEQSKLLRTASLGLHVVYDIFFVMCYVSFFDYFTFSADCDFLGTKEHMYFEGVECLKMPHLLHLLVALSVGLLFLCVTALVVVASCDLDPVSRGVLASPAAYVRLKILIAKAVYIVFSNCLDSNFKVQSIGMVVSVALIVFWNLKSMPFYFNFTNIVWTGLWGGVMLPCVILTIIAFGKNNSDAFRHAMTQNVLYGMVPVIWGTMVLTGLHVWWAMRPANKFRNLELGVKLSKVYKFQSVYQVERLARIMRKFNADGLVEEQAAALGEVIIKAGLQTFPNAPHLLILYANFVLEVHKDGPAARTQLQLVGKQMPNIVERYQVFCTNEASKRLKDSQAEGMDLQAYIEFKRNIRAVLRVHKEVLLQQSELWQLCMRSTLKVAQLDAALEALDLASARADRVYKRVLERYPTNGKLLRCYGKFLEDVLHDHIAAARVYAGANRVGSSNALLSLDFGGALHNGVSKSKPEFLTSMSMMDDAVVVIDAEGTIMMVSQAVQKTFGYTKTDLEGANVSVLMPQPFSQRHAGYIERYASTGEAHVLDHVRDVVALHKERYVFPISLCVTKLSGVGTDSIFLGVIRPVPTSLLIVRAWITPNGVFLCADQQFSSAIGMLEEDMVGHTLASLVMDANAVVALLERCQAATAVELESGNITTELTFHHRFAEPVPFRVEVRMAGSDAQRILVLHCRRTDDMDGSILAVDTHMRIKFASCEVSLLLGYTMRKLTTMRLDQLLPPPYNALHGKWLRDPPHTSRPGSCRTGSVVHLVSEAGVQVPVRLNIHNLEIEANGSSGTIPLYIVKVKKVTPEEMFREKRLVLTTDFTGKILTVSPADSAVFEFRALSLLGTNLAESIDIFADWRQRSGETQMQMILLALLGKEQEMPGTSWRVRVHEPQGVVDPQRIHRISRSACLQVELEEEESIGEMDAETGVRVQVTLWRRDMLGGILELDEELTIRRASPLTGLITGFPTTAMLRKPLNSFLNIPHMSWERLVAASSHGHHKKSALKATNDRGSISPVMAFIGPHPDSGTMRLMVQGVETLLSGGRPKITLTLHPDTTFVGAHANIMRVLRLEESINGVASIANSSVHGDDDAISHVGRLASRANSAAASALRSRSALTAPQPRLGPSPSGLLLIGAGDVRRAERTVKAGSLRAEVAGNNCSSEDDAEDNDLNGAAGDDDDSSDALMAEATSVHRQATSKSEFVEQWVRSITHQSSLHQIMQQEPQRRSRKQRRSTKTATVASATAAATAPGGPLLREESSLLALPLASSAAADGAIEPWLRTTSRLGTDPKLRSIVEVDNCSSAGGNGIAAQQARWSPNIQQCQRRVASRMLSLKGGGPSEPGGGEYPLKPPDLVSHAAKDAATAENGTEEAADEAAKSDNGSSTLDMSSVDGGSQMACGVSSATDATSVSEVVIDARRAKLLKALNKLVLGPALIKHMDRLRLRSYSLIALMFFTHLIAYMIITSLIKKQYANVYAVHRQALVMDRSQLVVVRTVLGTYCERANVTEKVAGCIYTLNTSISRLVKNLLQMEGYHQGVYLGFDANKIAEPAKDVYAVWTTPAVDYQVFLDTASPQVVIERAGAWQLGNRFIAAAREAAYWMLLYKDNFKLHRVYAFILSNGLDSLFKVYATSLDYLVLAAWNSVRELRQDVLIFMIVEALVVQICCALYELYLVYRLEAARALGMLALVGLPGPVLRQLTAVEMKIVNDSDDETDEEGSLAGSENVRDGKGGGGGGSVKQSQQLAVAIASTAGAAASSAAATINRNGAEPAEAELEATGTASTAGIAASRYQCQQGIPAHTGPGKGHGLGGRTLRAMRFRMSRKSSAGDEGNRSSSSFHISGKTLLPSYVNLTKFTVPFLVWILAVIVVYVITLADLNRLQSPLASLNLASHIVYRYTRLRAIGAVFVTQDDTASKELWRPLLSSELDIFESEYNALMYGGIPSTMENSTFRREVPAATFQSNSFVNVFFRSKSCYRYNQSSCFVPGDQYYEITHNGLDAMVRRMVYEMRLLSLDDAADVTYNSSRYAFTSIVGANDLYEGLQQAAQLFVDFFITHYRLVITMHTILLAASVAFVLAYFVFLLLPHISRTTRNAARHSALLSLVPPEMDVRAHVRAIFKPRIARKKIYKSRVVDGVKRSS